MGRLAVVKVAFPLAQQPCDKPSLVGQKANDEATIGDIDAGRDT